MHGNHSDLDQTRKEGKKHPKVMMSVENMLNPVEADSDLAPLTSPGSPAKNTDRMPPPKKQKLTKDAPVFVEGKPRGPLRYPPQVVFPDDVQREITRFRIHPRTQDISRYPRHIPYSSAKKGFQQKTGREAFEVFHYTFEVPGDDQEYVVMWDYNIGLVRITPFFKCCGYAKTVPGKMLAANPGLKDICHSITGGALAAQGYWMPYEAAKALAATFCHGIRYALLPLFGAKFASDCLGSSHDSFGHMVIDRAIVRSCTIQAAGYCAEEASGCDSGPESAGVEQTMFPAGISRLQRPRFTEPSYRSSGDEGTHQHRQARHRRPQADYTHSLWPTPSLDFDDRGRRNALSTTPDNFSYQYLPSPKSDTAMVMSGGALDKMAFRSSAAPRLPSPRTILASKLPTGTYAAPLNSPTSMTGDNSDQYSHDGQGSSVRSLSSGVSPKSKSRRIDAYREEYAVDSESAANGGHGHRESGAAGTQAGGDRGTKYRVPAPEVPLLDGDLETYKAAWMLLQLHMAEVNFKKCQICRKTHDAAHSCGQIQGANQSTAPVSHLDPMPALTPTGPTPLGPGSIASTSQESSSLGSAQLGPAPPGPAPLGSKPAGPIAPGPGPTSASYSGLTKSRKRRASM